LALERQYLSVICILLLATTTSCVPTPVDVAISLGIASKNNRASPPNANTTIDQKIELLLRRQLLDISKSKYSTLEIVSNNKVIEISGRIKSEEDYIKLIELILKNEIITTVKSTVQIERKTVNRKLAQEISKEISNKYARIASFKYSIEVIGNRIYLLGTMASQNYTDLAIRHVLAAYPEKEIISRLNVN